MFVIQKLHLIVRTAVFFNQQFSYVTAA